MDCLEDCIFVDESGFDTNVRHPKGWSAKYKPAIVTTASTILGVGSAKYVISMEFRNPQGERFYSISSSIKRSVKKLKINISNCKRKTPSKPKSLPSKVLSLTAI
ncbi:hypothetical protein BY458DRAFT_564743 [Sporodiniella umbellata]|nr:hypothetical protein BY458DRAFT_564743 [Sporodiniella umbellata]